MQLLTRFPELAADVWLARTATASSAPADPAGVTRADVTHSWLITGPPGSGRSVAARELAAGLLCTNPDTPACGECDSCRAVLNGSHTDLVLIQPATIHIPVDQVRDIIREATRSPLVGQWRVIVIEDADRFNEASGNAFLKTLEEPPAQTVIILCAPSTDPQDILPTLVSRCRHLYVPAPSFAQVASILEAEGIPAGNAMLAAHSTAAHIGRARRLATDSATQQTRARILRLAELIYHRHEAFLDVTELLSEVDKQVKEAFQPVREERMSRLRQSLGEGGTGKGAARAMHGTKGLLDDAEKRLNQEESRMKRDAYDQILMDFIGLYRDALIQQAAPAPSAPAPAANPTPAPDSQPPANPAPPADPVPASGSQLPAGPVPAPELLHPDFAGDSADLAAKHTTEQLVACIDAINEARERLTRNTTPRSAFFAMLGRIRLALGVD
ncbi:MAG: DNA polymerase III subunit delta' [Corynebacterium sp.]|nr:DNA polymerase III subunit delta' [Corynebacterium sp.]